MSGEKKISNRLVETLKRFPKNTLLADDCGKWSGEELEQHMRPLLKIIQTYTLPGSRVGICFPNWAVQGFAILTTIIANRVPVILSHADVISAPDQWLKQPQLSMLIASEELAIAEMHRLPLVGLNRMLEIKINNLKNQRVSLLRDILWIPPRGTALMLYTSGSMGTPKGVFVPAEGLMQTADYLISYFDLHEKTVSPIVLPVCHSMALNTQFFPTFLAGGTSYFWNSRLGINRVYRTILSINGRFVSLIGEVLRTCWEEKRRKDLEPAESVEHVQLAGGLIVPQHIQMAKELFPNATVHKGYGLTEAIRVTMINDQDPDFTTNVVGHPLPFQEIEIRRESGKQCVPFEVGQVFVKGPNVLLGISGKRGSVVDSRGFLATGDLGFLNMRGQLGVVGRIDSLFKINGNRVSGIEIEKIARSLSAMVRDVKCIAVEDSRRIGSKVVLFLEVPIDLQETFFQKHLQDFRQALWESLRKLPYFPRDIVVLERFPRTSNGKLQIQALHDEWRAVSEPHALTDTANNLKFFRSQNEQII